MSAHQFHQVRLPAFAGMFYPASADELRRLVQFCLDGAVRCTSGRSSKAFVLPHAGYVYSGPVAGSGYRCLQMDRDIIKRVIVLGPSHRATFTGIAVSEASEFATPLGEIPVDESAIGQIREFPQVRVMESAHAHEHSIEVHLPFLQVVLENFTIVPLVVGEAREEEISVVLEKIWGGPETRIIVSSDLSHFHQYAVARQLDEETAERIEKLEPVEPDQACGCIPLNGLLCSARLHKLNSHILDLRNSGDTAGDRARVVGYGAIAFGKS